MTLLDCLTDERVWISFYEQRTDHGFMRDKDAQILFSFIRQKRYNQVVDRMLRYGYSIPVKRKIAKEGSTKKRVVYTLPEEETMVMKLLTWLLIRKYDYSFSSNLYSFRPGTSIKSALHRIISHPGIRKYYSYKLDIRNYFNSIDVQILLPSLRELFGDDVCLYEFLKKGLSDLKVYYGGEVICEKKGVMAGMPTAAFFANVYLTELDKVFETIPDVIYSRYSDDIIIFAPDQQVLAAAKSILLEYLEMFHLEVNPDKVFETSPGEKWTFLGFSYQDGVIDVSDVSLRKLKSRMRRKSRALTRWKKAKGKEDWMAARAFIKYFNRKLYTNDDNHETNWSRWYFPLLTTDRSLKEIDAYMQDCIRYIVTESRTKSRFNFRYEHMKEMGYINLVNRYYHYHNVKTSSI